MEQIIPPHATEIEKDVLSVICNRPELVYQVEDLLDENCFYQPDYKFLFSVVMEIHTSGAVVSQSAILHRIIPSGRQDILGTYQEIKRTFSSEKFLVKNAEILAEYSTKRALLTKALEILQMIQRNDDIDEIENEVTEASTIALSRNKNTEAISMDEALEGMFDLMNREQTNGITGIPTGLPMLDKITGGWEFDDKVIFAARPGMGKTVAATFHSFYGAMVGYPTALISLEVRPAKLVARMMSNTSGFNSSDITKGRLAKNQKEIIIEKAGEAKKIPLYFYDNTRSCDINDIVRTLRTWHRKYGLKAAYLDYVGLCEDRMVKNASDATAVMNSVMKKLTRLGNQLGIPLILFSQLNRDNEGRGDKRPILKDLKSSGKLEEDATRVIFLYRQDYYDYNEAESRGENFVPTHDIEYIFAKNREGQLGPVLLKCNVALNRMYEPASMSVEMPKGYHRNDALNGAKTSFS
ncbi:replicative DNA helicase [Dyadobacter chenwenxiniae]|uniref:DNA 5'-3' helicase n=1 Tax=Dyadobacter chenwenxiniae TaxID=2906456 RepID=A0A9X1PES4_9BACT|nr:replicative DNA helicase [Dyadobacter chenwenxiniae]MCF0059880.1 replicative DNA helicase [Dyadobacter chenwenxiniae]UON85620.1 replicative DNA helicase [Dyadobacter chenwenxiniae]